MFFIRFKPYAKSHAEILRVISIVDNCVPGFFESDLQRKHGNPLLEIQKFLIYDTTTAKFAAVLLLRLSAKVKPGSSSRRPPRFLKRSNNKRERKKFT